jgi:predicted flap endonuclease-1-like 5' DNA nuclease
LRAFTAADRKTIKQAAENFPESSFYEVDELLTQLGIGEAFVTLLNEKGIPTPLIHTMLNPPQSRMDVLTEAEINAINAKSKLVPKYNQVIDSESAHEILSQKLAEAQARTAEKEATAKEASLSENDDQSRKQKEESFFDNPIVKQVGRTAASIITRSLLGALGLGGRSRTSTRRR